jgi:hypothetical protein
MPFAHAGGFRFSLAAVRNNVPAVSGVYGISNAREWLFIGEADDIQSALLGHLRELGTFLESRAPTGFTYEVCAAGYRTARQDWLILEYEPICNRRVGVVSDGGPST